MKKLMVVWLWAWSASAFTANDTAKTILTDGTIADTSSAFDYVVNKAQDGWVMTVGVASGSYSWASGISANITNTFTIQGADPNNRPTLSFGNFLGYGIQVSARSNHIVTIKDFILTDTGGGPTSGYLNENGQGVCFRISNVQFVHTTQLPQTITIANPNQSDPTPGPYGLIDNCSWSNTGPADKSRYGIFVYHNGNVVDVPYGASWTNPMTWGTTNAVVVENCWVFATLNATGQPFIDSCGGARWAVRYCNFTNITLGTHGYQCGGGNSTLQTEVYENTFFYDQNNYPFGIPWTFWLRGGTSVIWSNTVRAWGSDELQGIYRFSAECASTDWMSEGCSSQAMYPADYPIIEQVGQGVVNNVPGLTPIYVWSNSVAGLQNGQPFCILGINTDAPFIQQGRDIFTNQIVMPGYTPLVYPYPGVNPIQAASIARITTLRVGKAVITH